jgi:hypothetical protein
MHFKAMLMVLRWLRLGLGRCAAPQVVRGGSAICVILQEPRKDVNILYTRYVVMQNGRIRRDVRAFDEMVLKRDTARQGVTRVCGKSTRGRKRAAKAPLSSNTPLNVNPTHFDA